MRLKLLIGSAVSFALLIAGVTVYVSESVSGSIYVDGDKMVYDIPSGMTMTALTTDLVERGIVETPALAFRIYARVTRGEGQLKAGEYELRPGMTPKSVLSLFRSGKVIQRSITFIEGLTFRQWRALLSRQPLVTQTLAGKSDEAIMSLLGEAGVHPEGQFFPDTYQYIRGESDLTILKRAHRRMTDTVKKEWSLGTRSPVLATPQDALILASIVEKETAVELDRPHIAGVFMNRLAKEMRLQSDPTVIYGIEMFDGNLTRAHLAQDTPYNTYVVRGLPPTPICNPGLASIRAVLHPEPTNDYYFVSRGDGTSEFSETLEEHNKAVNRYQKGGSVRP